MKIRVIITAIFLMYLQCCMGSYADLEVGGTSGITFIYQYDYNGGGKTKKHTKTIPYDDDFDTEDDAWLWVKVQKADSLGTMTLKITRTEYVLLFIDFETVLYEGSTDEPYGSLEWDGDL